MTTKEIQQLICKKEILALNQVCENVNNFFTHEMDVCSMNKNGYLTEFEVKVSKADFKVDASKRKWVYFQNKTEKWIPNYFYYVCPDGLIDISKLPDFAGLIYVVGEELKIIKPAQRLHKLKHDKEKVLAKFCRVLSQRFYLGSCLITYLNKQIEERNKAREAAGRLASSIF